MAEAGFPVYSECLSLCAFLQKRISSFRSIRQELSILINLNHPHILQLKGFCLNPLSLILEFAPLKSLDKILEDYKRAGPRLDPYVLQKCVVQVGFSTFLYVKIFNSISLMKGSRVNT
jgi:hypothetical protein